MIAGVIPEFRWGADFAQAWRPAYPVDAVRYFDRPRVVERTVTLAGVEDAWIAGTDYLVAGRVRWMGRGQFASDAGFAGLGRAARDGAVRCYPDPVSAPGWFVSVYVEGVDQIAPEPEADFTMSAELTLRGASGAAVSPLFLSVGAGVDPAGVTFSRASTATYLADPAGVIASAASGVRRRAWRWGNLGRFESGLLLEPSADNRALRSDDFANATWVKTEATVTSNVALAPDGTATGDGFTENAGTVVPRLTQDLMPYTAGQSVAYSVHVAPAEREWVMLLVFGPGGTSGFRAWFNVRTRQVGATNAYGTGTLTGAWVEPMPDGWSRLHVVGVPATAGTTVGVDVRMANADPGSNFSFSYTGDGASRVFVWGAQVVTNTSTPSAYIPTTTASVARVADSYTVALAGTWAASPVPMTVYARGVLAASMAAWSDGTAPVLISTSGYGFGLIRASASSLGAAVTFDGGATFSTTAAVTVTPAAHAVVEMVGTYARGQLGLVVAVNGGAVSSGAATVLVPPSAWGNTTLRLGAGAWLHSAVALLRGTRTLPECRAFAGVSA